MELNSATKNFIQELEQRWKEKYLPLTYHVVQVGTTSAPAWRIQLKWGSSEYTTPDPIQGSQKHAEHVAREFRSYLSETKIV